MKQHKLGDFNAKRREWLQRYIPAEVLGTITALLGAWVMYAHTHSFVAATATGWISEGVGFYGYFISTELALHSNRYRHHTLAKRISLAIAAASTNLVVEFLPAELFDNILVRPFLMFWAPHYIHPYPIGFLVGKFSADLLFYVFAIIGYETKKHWINR